MHAARARTASPATRSVPSFAAVMDRRDFIVLLLGWCRWWCEMGWDARRYAGRRQVLLFRDASRCWSRTATTMISALERRDCSEMDRLLRMKTLVSVVKIRTPRTVPTIVPRPPVSSVPPMTTAAIASSS